ncbi:MAG TPA: DUF924 family protein [Sphingomicrobium sp.]|nr:DUF924 family protein [Sphingomicrobium sp.]
MSEDRPSSGEDWRAGILKFWFGLDEEQWWGGSPELDEQIRERFLDLWEEKRSLPARSFLDHPLTALAAVVLFDQFPRNMFRGHADQFSTDPLALAIAKGAVDAGLDDKLERQERAFLYMPFQHSEDLDDQQRALLLYTSLGNEKMLHYARLHYDIVKRFGRFPHRNTILGRPPRPEETAAGDVVPW